MSVPTKPDFLCGAGWPRGASAGDHVLLRLPLRSGQLLCLHDILPRLRLSGPGGECFRRILSALTHVLGVLIWADPAFPPPAVPGEPGRTPHLAAEPLRPSSGGGGGQQAQPRYPESEDDYGKG